jgi:hypothetical protein
MQTKIRELTDNCKNNGNSEIFDQKINIFFAKISINQNELGHHINSLLISYAYKTVAAKILTHFRLNWTSIQASNQADRESLTFKGKMIGLQFILDQRLMSSLLSLDRMRLLNEVSNPAERDTESLS